MRDGGGDHGGSLALAQWQRQLGSSGCGRQLGGSSLLSEIANCASCASIQMKSTMRLLDGGTHYHREAHQILK